MYKFSTNGKVFHSNMNQSDSGCFWTSSFKKLVSTTEDDKKLRVIGRILKSALGVEWNKDVSYTKVYSPKVPKKKSKKRKPKSNAGTQTEEEHLYETVKSAIDLLDLDRSNICVDIRSSTTVSYRKFPDCNKNHIEVEDQSAECPLYESIANLCDEEKISMSPPKKNLVQKRIAMYENMVKGGDRFTQQYQSSPRRTFRVPKLGDRNCVRDDSGKTLSPIGKLILRKQNKCAGSPRLYQKRPVRRSTVDVFEDCNRSVDTASLNATYMAPSNKSECSQEEPLYAKPMKSSSKTLYENLEDAEPRYDAFFKLKEEADVQCKVMKQATKAIELCRSGSTAHDRQIHIEAEKILLAATCRYERLLREIREGHYENTMKCNTVGTVSIRDIHVDIEERQHVEWFVCILSTENAVFCSKVLEVPPGTTAICFKEKFVFGGLESSFRIEVKLYSMTPPSQKDLKSKLTKFQKVSTLCRKSRKLFYKDLQTYSLVESSVPLSSFTQCGRLIVNLESITIPNNFNLTLAPNTRLSGYVDIKARVEGIHLSERKSGFITIGTESDSGIFWSRRWCVLDGSSFKYWSYPSQEDRKRPDGVLRLEDCIGEVALASRSLCARPRTLLLDVDGAALFLNIDTIGELHEWKNVFNAVYGVLQSWNMLRRQEGVDL